MSIRLFGPSQSQLAGTYGPGSTQWIQEVGAAFGFAFTAVTTTDTNTGLPTAATIRWPDGTTGAFTGTIDAAGNGYSGFVAAYGSKTLTASGITYDSNGLALGPTGLAVA